MGVRIAIGYALDEAGRGVAYASSFGARTGEAIRVPFGCRPVPALGDRPAAYAAVLAVVGEAHRRGTRRATFEIENPDVVADLAEHRAVPPSLAVPYVLLGCALNRFRDARLIAATDATCRDLEARARADVALHIAA